MTDDTPVLPPPEYPKSGPNHVDPADSEKVAEAIATGAPVRYDRSFKHRVHGVLRFQGQLPLASMIMRHRVAIDNRLEGLEAEPRSGTMLLAAALAGFDCGLLERPVIREDRTEVPNDAGGERIELVRVFYDHEQETDLDFLADIWLDYSMWRNQLAAENTVRAVGNASGATPGNA